MPPATPVRSALPPIFAMMTCWRGPMAFSHTPMISTGTGSGVMPLKTVQAMACMPGLTSLRGMISGFPALGGVSSAAGANPAEPCIKTTAAATISQVLIRVKFPLPYYDVTRRERGYWDFGAHFGCSAEGRTRTGGPPHSWHKDRLAVGGFLGLPTGV